LVANLLLCFFVMKKSLAIRLARLPARMLIKS
jgi:hypothetical protein